MPPQLPSRRTQGAISRQRAVGTGRTLRETPPQGTRWLRFSKVLRRTLKRERIRQLFLVSGISFLFHLALLIVFGLIVLPKELHEAIFTIFSPHETIENPDASFDTIVIPEALEDRQVNSNPESAIAETVADLASPLNVEQAIDIAILPESSVPGLPFTVANQTSGRSASAKQALLERYGGNASSEAAVNQGLRWLAKIQRPDGSWSFKDIGDAPNPGNVEAGTEMGATACALLSFLGAGHTHKSTGPYQDAVHRGFEFLLKGGESDRVVGTDFRGPVPARSHSRMYIHGLVSIAFAEGYGMTGDERLRRPLEQAVRFILAAQDPRGGGWRYVPDQKGDTSVVGWQLMALKSAQNSEIVIPPRTFAKVSHFLESVSADEGALYGYMRPQTNRPSTTAIGLLCQMYLGWDHNTPALKRGVKHLANHGPDFNDIYYGYYATQVLHHWGGQEWTSWNVKMRDGLVERQVKEGEHAGSWNPGGTISGSSGGRLFETCLAIMTLEVYYRHLPLYDRDKLKVELSEKPAQ